MDGDFVDLLDMFVASTFGMNRLLVAANTKNIQTVNNLGQVTFGTDVVVELGNCIFNFIGFLFFGSDKANKAHKCKDRVQFHRFFSFQR